MGIKNLTKFLTEKYPEVFDRGVKLTEYASRRIAIDTAIFMCKFKASNSETWLSAFLSLVIWMRREKVDPVFVLDTGMPPEKAAEKLKRAETRKKQEQRLAQLEAAVDAFISGEAAPRGFEGLSTEHIELLKETYAKEAKRGGHNGSARRRLLLLPPAPTSDRSVFDIRLVQDKLARMKKHIFTIKPGDYDLLKKMLDVLHVQWVSAPGEAEKECARMVLHGEAAAVLSEDSDCLAYRAPVFLCKPDFGQKTVRRVNFTKLLDALEMSDKEFVDFCIMCGTDYNPNIKGIGACKSFNLIKKWKSIEHIPKLNTSVLNHESSRRLFCISASAAAKPPLSKHGQICEKELAEFLFKHNILTPVSVILEHLKIELK
jgi:5'-3' exonuclease